MSERRPGKPRSDTRRAALVATAIAVPVIVLIALLLTLGEDNSGQKDPLASPSNGGTSPLPAVTVAAPPSAAATTATACNSVLEQLPVSLAGLAPRVVHSRPDSPYVVAWGDPAIVLRCGVARPTGLAAASYGDVVTVDGVDFYVVSEGDDKTGTRVFTVVDRAVYIEVSVPKAYGQPPLGPLADAVAKALPTDLCSAQTGPGETPVPGAQLCTHRP